jgi:hypothetical protein
VEQDWWTPAQSLFGDRDVVHALRHFNKRRMPSAALAIIRQELLPHNGLDYEQTDTSFVFVYAMSRYATESTAIVTQDAYLKGWVESPTFQAILGHCFIHLGRKLSSDLLCVCI